VIAGIMAAREEGSRVIQQMADEINAVRARTRDLPRPRVFCEEGGNP
jgi:ABC-type Fe3+-hydroxamate transport system substrate-binding protein